MLDVLAIAEGSTVADVGAGTGYVTLRLAQRVGSRGRVLATDLQPELLDVLRARADDAGAGNVVTIKASASDAKLPRDEVDLVLMIDVYHELSDPRATLAQVHDALRSNGHLALVEYRAEDPAVAIKPEHKMTLEQIKKELIASEFRFVTSAESLPEQRVVIFARQEAPRTTDSASSGALALAKPRAARCRDIPSYPPMVGLIVALSTY